ncbi:MAG: 30S ribosomal protein S4 [Candidatus Magasanikbacteria bacterium]|nr:30S ribosomal protein S4 [Candidatus Magasanikbacteria bacterium]
MGKYIGPKNKLARRFGVHLGLKSNPAKVSKRLSQPPGVQGVNRRRKNVSSYGKQLLEKQKAKFMYGIRERQFSTYVEKSNKVSGDSGKNLHQFLEMRLDNVVYKMGFAKTRAQARQMVNHSLFTLNGKYMNIPSHNVKIGDEVAIKESKIKKKIFENIEEDLSNTELPSWISVDSAKKSGKVVSTPNENDFERVFDVKLIIEYYSSR